MPTCKHNKQKAAKGKLNVEIRHLQLKFENEHFQEVILEDDNGCSQCFVENTNAICAMHTTNSSKEEYFHPPHVYKISIDLPSSYDELQQLLAAAVPKHYGPAVIERNGKHIFPGPCEFIDGETIVFREIRPSLSKDKDIQSLHKKFKGPNMYSSLRSLCESMR